MRLKFLLALSLFFSASAFAQDSLKVVARDTSKSVVVHDTLKSIVVQDTLKLITSDSLKSFVVQDTSAQDDLMDMLTEGESENQKVFATFKSTYLINAQTNETVKKGTLDFRITHRFGDVA